MEDNREKQEGFVSDQMTNTTPSAVANTADRKVVSITEAAKINNVTRQAIYVAIKQKKLKATKKTRWEIDLHDLEEYRKNKYSREKSMFDGELLFDNNRGYYSVNQVAKILGVPSQKIYYATRTGMIKGARKGAAWVIHTDEVNRYRDEYLKSKESSEQAAS
ncbi:MAG: hypothetical protein S4CHLAM123_13680 [Chlamydiales bacterium]|nr:hypothetical protein [Chlamydiales bacterium]